MARIWFIPTSPNHIARYRPLLDALRSRGDEIRLICVDALLPESEVAGPQLRASSYPFEIFSYPPVQFCDQAIFMPGRARRLSRVFEHFLSEHAIDAIVYGSEYGWARRAMLRAARRINIPLVYMVDGLTLPQNPRVKFKLLRKRRVSLSLLRGAMRRLGFGPRDGDCGANVILVPNKAGAAPMAERAGNPDVVHVVGSPAHDELAAEARERMVENGGEWFTADEATAVRQRLGIPPSRPVVLYAAQAMDHRRIIRDLFPAVDKARATLMVKFHPRMPEDLAAWREWAASEGMRADEIVFCARELSSVEALGLCSACVVAFSTVAIESLIMRKPLVILQYLGASMALNYGKAYGAAVEAESPEELRAGIQNILADEVFRATLARNAARALDDDLLGVDGHSIDRILGHLDSVIHKHAEPRTVSATGKQLV